MSLTSPFVSVFVLQDTQISELQQELERVARAHDDVVRMFQGKLAESGVPLGTFGVNNALCCRVAHVRCFFLLAENLGFRTKLLLGRSQQQSSAAT